MNAWLVQHRKAFLWAMRRLVATPLNTLLSLLAIGVGVLGVLLHPEATATAAAMSAAAAVRAFIRRERWCRWWCG